MAWGPPILLLNLAVILPKVVNLELVSPGAMLQVGTSPIVESGFSKVWPKGRAVLLRIDRTSVWFFSDIIPISFGRVYLAMETPDRSGAACLLYKSCLLGRCPFRKISLPASFVVSVSIPQR